MPVSSFPEAVGERLHTGTTTDGPWLTVVGRVKQYTLDGESRIAMYFPHARAPTRAMNVVLRGTGDPAALTAAVRSELRQLDPERAMYGVRTMAERRGSSRSSRSGPGNPSVQNCRFWHFRALV